MAGRFVLRSEVLRFDVWIDDARGKPYAVCRLDPPLFLMFVGGEGSRVFLSVVLWASARRNLQLQVARHR